jgi:hypothetical protein
MTKVNLSKVRAAVVAALNEKVTVGDARVIMERGEGGRVTSSRHEIMVMSGKLTLASPFNRNYFDRKVVQPLAAELAAKGVSLERQRKARGASEVVLVLKTAA